MQRLSPCGNRQGLNSDRRRRPTTILCVDDEQPALILRRAILQRAGYRVLIADNGCAALEIAKTRRIDLALIDLDMPGMNGYSIAALLRCTRPKARIIIFSGHDCHAVQKLIKGELDGCIEKGAPVSRFLEQVARHIAVRQGGRRVFERCRDGADRAAINSLGSASRLG